MTAPAGPSATRSGLRAPVLVGTAGLALVVLLRTRDPHESGTYGFCPFETMTGLPCPGCGGLRAVNDLTHGRVVDAVSSNVMAVALVASLAVLWIVWLVRRARGQHHAVLATISARAAVLIVVAFAVFGILRNTPWGAWLAP